MKKILTGKLSSSVKGGVEVRYIGDKDREYRMKWEAAKKEEGEAVWNITIAAGITDMYLLPP
jgi:hypothetical protein